MKRIRKLDFEATQHSWISLMATLKPSKLIFRYFFRVLD